MNKPVWTVCLIGLVIICQVALNGGRDPRDSRSSEIGTSFKQLLASLPANADESLEVPMGENALPSDLTIPPNISLTFRRGATINVSAGRVLTIQGDIQAGNYPIFSGAGSVSFEGNKNLSVAEARWWGAAGDGVSDDTSKLQAALHAIAKGGNNRIAIHFPQQTFRVCNLDLADKSDPYCPVQRQCLAPARIFSDGGASYFGATLKATNTCGAADYVASLNSVASTRIEDLRIDGNAVDHKAGTGTNCLDARYLATNVTTAAATHNVYQDLTIDNCLDSDGAYGAIFDGNEDSEYANLNIAGGSSRSGKAIGFRYLDSPGFPGVIENLKIYNGDMAQINTQNATLTNSLLTGGLVVGSQKEAAGNNLITIVSAQISPNKASGVVINFLRSPKSSYASENLTCIGCFLAPEGLKGGQVAFSGTVLSGAELLGGRVNVGGGQMYSDLHNTFVGYPLTLRLTQTTITGNQPRSSGAVRVQLQNTNDGAQTYNSNSNY